jgi:hypothetical protein
MNTYKCKFFGKERNALGINSYWEKNVEADTVDQAHFRLYNTHENIMKFVIINLQDSNDFKSSKHIH